MTLKSELHVDDEHMVAYVQGALDDGDVHALEAHVGDCAPCRERLAREARLELALVEVARGRPAPAPLVHPPYPRLSRSLLDEEPRRLPLWAVGALSATVMTALLVAAGVVRVNGDPTEKPAPTAVAAPAPLPAPAPAFSPPRGPARLWVTSTPWSTVYVDDVKAGVTPLSLELVPGAHDVTLVNVSGERHRRLVSLAEGGSVTIAHHFGARGEERKEQAGQGTLTIAALPWATVTVDGEPVGTTPLRLRLAEGEHRVLLASPTEETRAERTVVVRDGERTVLKVDLRE